MGIALQSAEIELAYVNHAVFVNVSTPARVAPRWNDAPMWDLHPGVVKIWLACWSALFLVFVATFSGTAHTLFQLAIVAAFGMAFFGLPIVLSGIGKQAARRGSLDDFLHSRFETGGGTLSGFETLIQVVMVPLALLLGAVFISFVVAMARANAIGG